MCLELDYEKVEVSRTVGMAKCVQEPRGSDSEFSLGYWGRHRDFAWCPEVQV